MKKSLLALPLLLCGFMAFAQDKVVYDANAEIRNVSSFHAVEVSNGINLILKQGNTDAVAVSASSTDVIKRIKTEVVNGKLKISVGARSLALYLLNGIVVGAVLYFLSRTSLNTWLTLFLGALASLLFMWSTKMMSLNSWLGFLKK